MLAFQSKAPRNMQRPIEEWVDDILADHPNFVSLPELADRALEEWGNRPEFIEWVVSEALRPILHSIVQKRMADYRRPIRVLEKNDDKPSIVKKRDTFMHKFDNWFEQVAPGTHVCVMSMTRPQLRAAAAIRRQRAKTEIEHATWLDAMADKLMDDLVDVREFLGYETVYTIYGETHPQPIDLVENDDTQERE